MPAFISYSEKDEASYTTMCVALEGQRVEYWDPKTMRVGVSLREQLREAIRKCEVCIFLATRNSVESKWCLAEIGAFWGAGITVVVFIADSDLDKDQIPPQFQGDLWTRDIRKVIASAKAEISANIEKQRINSASKPRLVSEMTIDIFCELLSSLRARSDEGMTLAERMVLLQGAFLENDADAKAFAFPLLNGLIGASRSDIKSIGERHWEDSFILGTDTGEWLGFSDVLFGSPVANGYENCLLVHFDSGLCDAALIVDEVWADKDESLGCGNLIANCGSIGLGEVKSIAPPLD